MAARPGGKGPTLYEVAGWIQGVVAAVFGVVGWLNRRDKPEIDRNDWRPVRVGIALGAILAALALALLTRTLLIAFGLIDGVDRWSELRNSLLVIGVIVGAPFVVWRTMIADRQTNINQQTHYTDLYTKAVEMLGADKVVKKRVKKTSSDEDAPAIWETVETTEPNIEVRLGAIYALQRIMNQSDDDYLPIIKTLCAYVRSNVDKPERLFLQEDPAWSSLLTDEEAHHAQKQIRQFRANAESHDPNKTIRTDIRAAIELISQRRNNFKNSIWKPDLSYVNFQGANMIGFNFHEINFFAARLEGAFLPLTCFEDANLAVVEAWGASFSDANFCSANLMGAHLNGSDVHDANFAGALLAATKFTNAHFLTYDQLASAFGDAATRLPPELEAERPRLIAEAGWAEDEIPLHELVQRWAAWRAARNL